MGNVKGIILNGEWLGSNVIINEMFNVIYSISPVIMLEFIRIVNDIEKLEDAIQINNFNYNKKNVIDIEFSNNELSGLASLLFEIKDGKAKLLNSFLKVNRGDELEQKVIKPVKEESEEVTILKEISAKLSTPLRTSVERYDGYYDNGYYNDGYNQGYGQYDEYGNYSEGQYDDGYSDGYGGEYGDDYNQEYDNSYNEEYYQNDEYDNNSVDYNDQYSTDEEQFTEKSEAYSNENHSETAEGSMDESSSDLQSSEENTASTEDEEEIIEEVVEETVMEEVVNEDGEVVVQEVKKPKTVTKKVKKSSKSENAEATEEGNSLSSDKDETSSEERTETDDIENKSADSEEKSDGGKSSERQPNKPGERKPNMRDGQMGGRPPMGARPPMGGRPPMGPGARPPMGPGGRPPVPPAGRPPVEQRRPAPAERPARETSMGLNKKGQEVVITIENAEINVTHSGAKGDVSGLTIKDKSSDAQLSVNTDKVKAENVSTETPSVSPAAAVEQQNQAAAENLLNPEEQRNIIEELRSLKEELQNIQANKDSQQTEVKHEQQDGPRMTLEEFLEQQRKKKESKIDSYGYRFKIIGSNRQRMQAEVLDNGVFIADDKVYKWGDMLQLDN